MSSDPQATQATRATDGQPEWLEISLRIACVAASIAVWAPALRLLSRIWEESEFFGHGFLIPVVSLFLIYADRRNIARALRHGQPPPFGFLLVLLAVSFEVVAITGEVATAAGVGIPCVMAATAYALGGGEAFRSTRLPFGFLILMVPPPGFVLDGVLVQLKLMVTSGSIALLQTLGFTVAFSGNQVLLPEHTLFVADACSGLTSIVTLLPLAVVVAYFLSHGIWRRIAVVASVLPLAIGANMLRVVITVAVVSRMGIEYSQGLLHEGFGVTTYVVGTLVLLLVAKVLR